MPAEGESATVGLFLVLGVLFIFAFYFLFKAYKGLVRRCVSIRYKPFRFSAAEGEALPWKRREIKGVGAIILGTIYAVCGLACVVLLVFMVVGALTG